MHVLRVALLEIASCCRVVIEDPLLQAMFPHRWLWERHSRGLRSSTSGLYASTLEHVWQSTYPSCTKKMQTLWHLVHPQQKVVRSAELPVVHRSLKRQAIKLYAAASRYAVFTFMLEEEHFTLHPQQPTSWKPTVQAILTRVWYSR